MDTEQLNISLRAASDVAVAARAKPVTVTATVASTTPVWRDPMDGSPARYEVLDMAGLDLTEREGAIPVLIAHFDHPFDVGGEVKRLWRDGDRIKADLLITDDTVIGQINKGLTPNLSVGFVINAERQVEPDTVLITDWSILEVSIVAIGADPKAGVGRVLSISALRDKLRRLGADIQEAQMTEAPKKSPESISEDAIAEIVKRTLDDRASKQAERQLQATAAAEQIEALVAESVKAALAARDEAEAKAAEAKSQAEEAERSGAAEVKRRTELIVATRDLLPKDADPHSMTEREILLAAAGDEIPDAADQTDDYLRGAINGIVERRKAATAKRGLAAQSNGAAPQFQSIHDLREWAQRLGS